MNTKLLPDETELIGKWSVVGKDVRGDDTCKRIKWLVSNHLQKIAVSEHYGAWETLFQDPDDRRYWEQTYPQAEMHGGGPPQLRYLTDEEAKKKYAIK